MAPRTYRQALSLEIGYTVAKERSTVGYRGGYATAHKVFNRLFNVCVALVLLTLTSPLFVIIAAVILLYDGRPVFYKGQRLGKDKKLFTMIKFRTLIPDAEKIIGPEVLTTQHRVVTPAGKFLRTTRLDELPQLFNVLTGDMDFFGPRPQRPEVYESICKEIKGYDMRFSVKPGLIGYPQLFLPHGAPKRIQSIVDNKFLWKQQIISWEIFIIFYTSYIVTRKVVYRTGSYIWNILIRGKLLGHYSEKRELDRLRTREATVRVLSSDGDGTGALAAGELRDINEKAFAALSDTELETGDYLFEVVVTISRKQGRAKRKLARCRGRIVKKTAIPEGERKFSYVVEYTPVSPFNNYLFLQYLLKGSLVD